MGRRRPGTAGGGTRGARADAVKCLLDGDEPNPDVAELLKSDRWRLIEMNTGHWPMFSRPRELAGILLQDA